MKAAVLERYGDNRGVALEPVLDKVFALDQVREALAHSESGRATGKVVLKVS